MASLAENGSISLRLRLPDALSKYGKHLIIKNLWFQNGHDTIVAAIKRCLARGEDGTESGVAISYYFLLDKKGWRVFVTVSVLKPETISRESYGNISIDINSDCIAVVETDRSLNLIRRATFPLCTYGKDRNKTKALIGDVVKKAVEWAIQARKPLVIESFFRKEKKSTQGKGKP